MPRLAIALAVVLSVGGCLRPPALSGFPCETDGRCAPGYTCDAASNTCISTGDACDAEGVISPCAFGETTCANGCRTCVDGAWSECGPGPQRCVDRDGDGLGDGTGGNVDCLHPATDVDDTDPSVCADIDGDGCDDCSLTTWDPTNDGPDADGDTICDLGDACPGLDDRLCGARSCNGLLWQEQQCASGSCSVTVVQNCDDGDPCTTDSCSDTIGCSHVPIPVGGDCGICGVCDASGNCVDDLTQHDDCPFCHMCAGVGNCVPQSSKSDLKNECPDSPCAADVCNGEGGCALKPAGTECDICGACDDGGSCVYHPTQNGDCGFCEVCAALGACAFQYGTDVKHECPTGSDCSGDVCDGAGACVAALDGTWCTTCSQGEPCGGCEAGVCANPICFDEDGDGYQVGLGCGLNDCDDNPDGCGAACHPGLSENADAGNCEDDRDNNCDGLVDCSSASCMDACPDCTDGDNDGVTTCGPTPDCHDDPAQCGAACSPLLTDEVCDGYDNDCSHGGTPPPDEVDADGDGYIACSGYVERGAGFLGGGDCDDTNAAWFPGMEQPLTITTTSAVPKGYSVSVAFNHAEAVSSGRSAADGTDVRVIYNNGTTWVQIDRALDPDSAWNEANTRLWFALQEPLEAEASSTAYALVYGTNRAPVLANEGNVFHFADFFERPDDASLGNGWQEIEGGDAAVSLEGGGLFFESTLDHINRPVADHDFVAFSGTSRFEWRFGFNWVRTGNEGTYRLHMQLGNSADMESPPNNEPPTVGVGPSLVWTHATAHEQLCTEKDENYSPVQVCSGYHPVRVLVDMDAQNYTVSVDDGLSATAQPVDFSSQQSTLDRMRFVTWQVHEGNITSRRFEYVIVRPVVTPEPVVNVETARSRCPP